MKTDKLVICKICGGNGGLNHVNETDMTATWIDCPDCKESKAIIESPFQQFLRGYIAALVWSDTDDEISTGQYDLSKQGLNACQTTALAFFEANRGDLDQAVTRYDLSGSDGTAYEQAGHDFALTRNRHGVGFWDRPELESGGLGQRLTEQSQNIGECYLELINQEVCVYED